MSIREYILDHLGFILTYYLGAGICALIVILDAPALYDWAGAAFYGFLLATALLAGVGVWDYQRSKPFYDRLKSLSDRSSPPDAAAISLPAANHLESLTASQILNSFRNYQEELNSYRSKQEERQRFSDRWAHYMKTPVSVISLLVQKGRECGDSEEKKDVIEGVLDGIEEENNRLLHGLDVFLNLARLDSFEVDVHIEPVDLSHLAREIINRHRREFVMSSVFPKLECAKGKGIVSTDKKWLGFVLEQLITNAIKYGRLSSCLEAKSLLVKIEEEREPAGEKTVSLSVIDQGIGIPQEDLPRIFQPFFTGKNGRLLAETTGMGLYLTREVLTRLGHKILCESQVGKGTAMKIVFSSKSIVEGVLR